MCDFVSKLYKEGDDESRAMAKNLSSRQRFVTPIIVRGEEKEGAKLWTYSKKVYESLLQLVLNPDYGDVSDEKEGIDLVITYGKAAGMLFPTTSVTPRRKSSPLSTDRDLLEELLEINVDFAALFDRKTPDQVEQILDRHLLGDEKEEVVKGGKADDGEDDIDRKFSEMLA